MQWNGLSSNNQSNNILNDTTIFTIDAYHGHQKLELIDSNRFQLSFDYNYTNYAVIFGTFIWQNFRVTLFPESITTYEYNSKNSKTKVRNNKYKNTDLKIKTIYDVFTWGNTIYLLSPEKNENYLVYGFPAPFFDAILGEELFKNKSDYFYFAQAYNEGWEPENHGLYLTRTIDSIISMNQDLDMDQIPKEYHYLFLSKPIQATIKQVDAISSTKLKVPFNTEDYKESEGFIVVLDKGSRDQLRVGNQFFDIYSQCTIDVISVFEDSCIGVCWEYIEVNEEVKTQWGEGPLTLIDFNSIYFNTRIIEPQINEDIYYSSRIIKLEPRYVTIYNTIHKYGRQYKYSFNTTYDTLYLSHNQKIYFQGDSLLFLEKMLDNTIITESFRLIDDNDMDFDLEIDLNINEIRVFLNKYLLEGLYSFNGKIVEFLADNTVSGLSHFSSYNINVMLGTHLGYNQNTITTDQGIWEYRFFNNQLILTKYSTQVDESDKYILSNERIILDKIYK
jgi:hypothetical protein